MFFFTGWPFVYRALSWNDNACERCAHIAGSSKRNCVACTFTRCTTTPLFTPPLFLSAGQSSDSDEGCGTLVTRCCVCVCAPNRRCKGARTRIPTTHCAHVLPTGIWNLGGSCSVGWFNVFIDRPSLVLPRERAWSCYKNHKTATFIFGIARQGVTAFIFEGWGGRTSDRKAAEYSGILDSLHQVIAYYWQLWTVHM